MEFLTKLKLNSETNLTCIPLTSQKKIVLSVNIIDIWRWLLNWPAKFDEDKIFLNVRCPYNIELLFSGLSSQDEVVKKSKLTNMPVVRDLSGMY